MVNFMAKNLFENLWDVQNNSADAIGTIAFSEFMNPSNQFRTINFTFYMTDVVRQKDEQFKNVLSLMRNGTLNSKSCDYLINRFLSRIKNKKLILVRLFILLHNKNIVLDQQLITSKC